EPRFIPNGNAACSDPFVTRDEHERLYRFRIGLPDGSLHILHLRGFENPGQSAYWADGFYGVNADGRRSPCARERPGLYPADVVDTLTYYTADGSYLRLEIPADGVTPWYNRTWTLFFPDGHRAVGKGADVLALYDANTISSHINPPDAIEG